MGPRLFPDDCATGRKWFRRGGKAKTPPGGAGLSRGSGDGNRAPQKIGPRAPGKVQIIFRRDGNDQGRRASATRPHGHRSIYSINHCFAGTFDAVPLANCFDHRSDRAFWRSIDILYRLLRYSLLYLRKIDRKSRTILLNHPAVGFGRCCRQIHIDAHCFGVFPSRLRTTNRSTACDVPLLALSIQIFRLKTRALTHRRANRERLPSVIT